MGWIGCVRYETFRCNFVARTFALIEPVQPILHRALCSNETIQNAPKYYETLQNMSIGSNGGGLSVFVATNSGATLWHKLLH
jgi:hypothetical protein